MKTLASLLTTLLLAASALAHEGVEIGPNGGRLVEFGEGNPLHAEFVLKGDQFVVSLYDEATKKEVPVSAQTLTITHKEGNKKLTPEVKDGKWTVAKPEGKDFWLILQLKDAAGAKAKNGRLHYDETICSACKAQEWVCKCSEEEKK